MNQSERCIPDLGSIKMSVSRVILLVVITLTLFYPVWFLNIRPFLNTLNTKKKVGLEFPVLVMVATVVYFAFGIIEGFLDDPIISNASLYFDVGMLIVDMTLTLESLKIRKILIEHYKISLSWWATLFLGIVYLQYRINRI